MGHNVKFSELFNGYAYIRFTAHVLQSHSCTMMGTYFQTTFRKKKKDCPREQNVLLLLFYFPKMLLPSYHAFLQELQKKKRKITRNSQNKIHISEKLLRVPALD